MPFYLTLTLSLQDSPSRSFLTSITSCQLISHVLPLRNHPDALIPRMPTLATCLQILISRVITLTTRWHQSSPCMLALTTRLHTLTTRAPTLTARVTTLWTRVQHTIARGVTLRTPARVGRDRARRGPIVRLFHSGKSTGYAFRSRCNLLSFNSSCI